jgi:hypothetical protein
MHDGAYRNWGMNRIENGQQEVLLERLDEADCRNEVIALRSKRFTVRTIGIPGPRANRTAPKGRIDLGNAKKSWMSRRISDFEQVGVWLLRHKDRQCAFEREYGRSGVWCLFLPRRRAQRGSGSGQRCRPSHP